MARIRRRHFQVAAGLLGAIAAIVAHLFPLTLGSAASVSLETVVVAVTGLIAGWLGSAVALLFLTVVTFATAETLGAALLCAAIDIAVAVVCVVGVQTVRRVLAGNHQRRRLRRHLVLHRRESLDCTVSIAGTGADALELLRSQTFDLVFMDCQMPGMDGYETTRRMRAVLHRYIPVVAITANAMIDDKQRCLDAGMDDFLPKPFTKSALSDVLCKWLVPGANAIADGEIAERIAELPALAAPVFDELWQSLQWRLSPLRKIYESFLSVAHETLDMLEGDSPMLARRLHTLLGSAGMVGARQVERVTAWLAEAAQADRRTELESGRELLAETVRRFEAELERRLEALTR